MKYQDCSTCQWRVPHPAPTHPGQRWYCNTLMLWVGERVMNCTHHKLKPAETGAAA